MSPRRAAIASLFFCIPAMAGILTGCQSAEKWRESARNADSAFKQHQYDKCQTAIELAFTQLGSGSQNGKERFDLLVLSGNSYVEDGKYDQAANAFQQALTLGETLYGPQSVRLSPALDGLRGARFRQKKYELAESFARRLLSVQEAAYGANDPRVEPALSAVISASCISGKCADETDLLQRLLQIREKMLGPDHKHTFVARQLVAESYVHRRQYDKALALYEENLQSARRANSSLVAGALINIGRVCQSQKHYRQAQEKLQQALTLQQLSGNKSAISGTLIAIADVYKDEGKLEPAIRTYKEALEMAEKIPHKDQSVLTKYLEGYADALKKAGKQAQANQVQQQIDRIAEEDEAEKSGSNKRAI